MKTIDELNVKACIYLFIIEFYFRKFRPFVCRP